MTAANDIVVLTEYAEWREERAMGGPEDRLSVAVFIEEREAGANVRRIEDAMYALEALLSEIEDKARATNGGGDTPNMVVQRIARALDILVDDRDVIEERTLTGPTTRTIL